MSKKIMYVTVLICGLSLFSSAKQIGIGYIQEIKDGKKSAVTKKTAKGKKMITANIRPFNFYLFNI